MSALSQFNAKRSTIAVCRVHNVFILPFIDLIRNPYDLVTIAVIGFLLRCRPLTLKHLLAHLIEREVTIYHELRLYRKNGITVSQIIKAHIVNAISSNIKFQFYTATLPYLNR